MTETSQTFSEKAGSCIRNFFVTDVDIGDFQCKVVCLWPSIIAVIVVAIVFIIRFFAQM